MGLGLAVGRENIEDTDQYRKAMEPARRVSERFQEEVQGQFGISKPLDTTLCREIQTAIYSRSFDLNNPEENKMFLAAGGHTSEGCPKVCAVAAQVVAEEILSAEEG